MSRARRRRWRARIGGVWALCAAVVALAGVVTANAAEWIVDPSTGCGTTSLFSEDDESIRWYGACRGGKLEGPGVLIWYQGGIESERDEGTFRNGELEGEAVIRLANGASVYGTYRAGIRHGDFVIVRADGTTIHGVYDRGRLLSEEIWSARKAAEWRNARAASAAPGRESVAAQAEEPSAAPPASAVAEETLARSETDRQGRRQPRLRPSERLAQARG